MLNQIELGNNVTAKVLHLHIYLLFQFCSFIDIKLGVYINFNHNSITILLD